jgi:hypothetical protein
LWLAAIAGLAFAADRRSKEGRFFDKQVAPILVRRCLGCHNRDLNNGNLSMTGRESLLKGGTRGPAIVPGSPEKSLLITVLRHEGEVQMPPGRKLPEREIRILTEWIRQGAVWGSGLPRAKVGRIP